MKNTTVYVCTGECHGVSPVMKNCGATSCSRFEMPLEARVPCDACAARSAQDGQPHVCENCR